MNDRPTAVELVAATRRYLETELIPTLSDARLRFQTLVAANVLSIVERDLLGEESQLLEEWKWLAGVLTLVDELPQSLAALRLAVQEGNKRLCERIHAGEFDDASRFLAMSRELRRTVERKLEIANPRYLATYKGEAASQARGS